MEVLDLMIGDWVQLKDEFTKHFPKYHKVDVLDIHKSIQSIDAIFDFRFEPIPLTKEILIANGFVFNAGWSNEKLYCRDNVQDIPDNQNMSVYQKSDAMVWSIWWSDKEQHKCTIWYYKNGILNKLNFQCQYVHELQHALRLCGLKALANNFKMN